MRYSTFRAKTKDYAFFRSNMFDHISDNPPMLRRQLVDWVKRGYVIPLKKGFYTLNNDDRKAPFSLFFLANNLYSPSYISLESALSQYHMIPEKVVAITSISSKKTQRFTNLYGHFIYHHIAPPLYGDFTQEQDEFGNFFYLATPERALADFFYFKGNGKIKEDLFNDSFRLQNTEHLNLEQLKMISKKFNSSRLEQLVQAFTNTLRHHHVKPLKNKTG